MNRLITNTTINWNPIDLLQTGEPKQSLLSYDIVNYGYDLELIGLN